MNEELERKKEQIKSIVKLVQSENTMYYHNFIGGRSMVKSILKENEHLPIKTFEDLANEYRVESPYEKDEKWLYILLLLCRLLRGLKNVHWKL